MSGGAKLRGAGAGALAGTWGRLWAILKSEGNYPTAGAAVVYLESMNANEKNDPARAGQLATRTESFGGRYSVAAIHTRFDAVEWFVWDTGAWDPIALESPVIRQAATYAEAVRGLIR